MDVTRWFGRMRWESGMERLELPCWRRFALMAGAAVFKYRSHFRLLIETIESLRDKDLFKGLIEAAKPCSIDTIFLWGDGGLNILLMDLIEINGIHRVYANKWRDIAKELEELRSKWLSRGSRFVEAVYALGLSILLAGAKAAGEDVDAKAAETALWLSGFSMRQINDSTYYVDNVIRLLTPLRNLHRSGWTHLISNAASIAVTNLVHEMLDNIYVNADDLDEWVKARLVETYVNALVKTGYDEYSGRAAHLLSEVKDDTLKIIIKTHVYERLASTGKMELYGYVCEELEKLSRDLEEIEKQASLNPREFLKRHPELRKYLEWRYVARTEVALNIAIKEAQTLALLGLGHCARNRGEFKMAEDYYRRVADASRRWGWAYYIAGRLLAAYAMALRTLMNGHFNDVINEFEGLWNEYIQESQKEEQSASSPGLMTYILGGYLIALALTGRLRDAEKLLKDHDELLSANAQLNVATHFILKYLGAMVDMPSEWGVSLAMLWHVKKAFSEILDEILGKSTTDEPSCKELREPEDKLCTYAHMAMKGDKEAEDAIRRFITLTLSSAGVPRDLLDRANTRQLIEVYAPATSMGQFILLLRALALGDKDLAILHAEVGSAMFNKELPKRFFRELANALRSGDEGGARKAVAKLYYYHFF